jgi:chaperonin GroES
VIIKPLKTYVFLTPDQAETQTKSGIILPGAEKKKMVTGTVFEVGPEVMVLMKGDKIAFNEYGFDDIELGGTRYKVGKEEQVVSILL